MNGYSKLILVNKSRSIDFSDLSTSKTFPDQTHENFTPVTSETDNQDNKTINHYEVHDHEDEDEAACSKQSSSVGAKYLSKNYSVFSATSSHRFKLEMQRSNITRRGGLQSALKRAFSMRRSSSSSVFHEKYCRIHDQCVAILLDDDVDVDVDEDIFEATEDNNITSMSTIRYMEKKKCGSNKGRILKACKRILGF